MSKLRVVGGKEKDSTNSNVKELLDSMEESKLDGLFSIGWKDGELILFSTPGLSVVETLGALEYSKFFIMAE